MPFHPQRWQLAGRLFVFAWFLLGGIAHFTIPQSFLLIMPPAVPYPLEVVYISGAFELLGAAALWIPSLRTLAGYSLILLTICVTPCQYLYVAACSRLPEYPRVGSTGKVACAGIAAMGHLVFNPAAGFSSKGLIKQYLA